MSQLAALESSLYQPCNISWSGQVNFSRYGCLFDWDELDEETRTDVQIAFDGYPFWEQLEDWLLFGVLADFEQILDDIYGGELDDLRDDLAASPEAIVSLACEIQTDGLWCLNRKTGEVWLADDGSFSKVLDALDELEVEVIELEELVEA